MTPTLYPSLGILPHPLYGSWPGPALFEGLSHPQQLNPLPFYPEGSSPEG